MVELADSNLNDLSPGELKALEDALREQLRIYLRHLVGIVGVYEYIDASGNGEPKKPFCFSAVVLDIRDQWFLATAGHVLEKLDAAIDRPDMELVECGLGDLHVSNSHQNEPILHFDYANARRFHHNKNGLDFGLVHLRQNYRDLLAANGVQPLSEQSWSPTELASADTFLMVGFPEDCIDSGITSRDTHYEAWVKASPTIIPIDRLTDLPDDIPEAQHDRFVGQMPPSPIVGSIVGMSGGPIFCFKGDEFEPYYVAAIQSTWLPKRKEKLTFGCPVHVMLDVAGDFISSIRG